MRQLRNDPHNRLDRVQEHNASDSRFAMLRNGPVLSLNGQERRRRNGERSSMRAYPAIWDPVSHPP
ncbi:hypothetical protein [Cohnella sp. CFH 77786]|uniref:hypothetical protein n=1 Tax=Cohnella sp. CFH 77786 TaxID=2662265 RepID=UPI001C60DE23|nr:hypothetical protein [Cohnella sp. CFH 77786]